MKKLLFIFLLSIIGLNTWAQDEDLDVEVKTPNMQALINRVWNNLPTVCTPLPSSVTAEGVQEECAGRALMHYRRLITDCSISDAFKEAIKLEFKLLKLIPLGKAAGTILDIADLTAKALSAPSPEAFEGELVKYGFGKVVGDDLIKKLKKVTGVPEGDLGDILGNITKLVYKQLIDQAKKAIFPKDETYTCQPGEPCHDNLFMTIQKVPEEDETNTVAYLVISGDGDCQCKISRCAGITMKEWSLNGRMALVIDKAEVVEKGVLMFKKKVLEITLRPLNPTFVVTRADCNCSNSDISYIPHTFTAGPSMVIEDSDPKFNTYGGFFNYTRFISSHVGLTADVNAHFGTMDEVKYRKIALMGGLTYALHSKKAHKKAEPFVRALAGASNLQGKYGDMKSSNTALAIMAGAGVDINLKKNTAVQASAYYNPRFYKGITASNFMLGIGIAFH